jgi:hypothetical protein
VDNVIACLFFVASRSPADAHVLFDMILERQREVLRKLRNK